MQGVGGGISGENQLHDYPTGPDLFYAFSYVSDVTAKQIEVYVINVMFCSNTHIHTH